MKKTMEENLFNFILVTHLFLVGIQNLHKLTENDLNGVEVGTANYRQYRQWCGVSPSSDVDLSSVDCAYFYLRELIQKTQFAMTDPVVAKN